MNPERVPPLALLPLANNDILGTLDGSEFDRVASEGARTVPPREHGGNSDIKNLTIGSRVYFPVYVEGAKLSLGDLHFSQGDGEISFCGAILMAGFIDLGVDLVKGGMERYSMTCPQHMPMFQLSHIKPRYSNYLVFEGISVEEDGEQHYMDAHVAFKQGCLNAITYLKGCCYTDQQALNLPKCSPD